MDIIFIRFLETIPMKRYGRKVENDLRSVFYDFDRASCRRLGPPTMVFIYL